MLIKKKKTKYVFYRLNPYLDLVFSVFDVAVTGFFMQVYTEALMLSVRKQILYSIVR